MSKRIERAFKKLSKAKRPDLEGMTSRMVERLEQGTKADGGKLRWDLMPFEALGEITKVMTFGAVKYEDRNWEKGILYGRVYAALMRHLEAWWNARLWRASGNDPETGLSHLAHAGCCLLFLLTYELRGMKKFDDRPQWMFGAKRGRR